MPDRQADRAATPLETAERYFACMRAGNLDVVELFHPSAELLGLGMRVRGRAGIEKFYAGVISGASPSPSPVGPLLSDADRVVAQVDIALADGTTVHALDVFHVEGGRIRSLTYFTADIPPS